MTLDKIELLLEAGNISKATVFRCPERAGKWSVRFLRNTGEAVSLRAYRNNLRQFATVDSAIRLLDGLGFKHTDVEWS